MDLSFFLLLIVLLPGCAFATLGLAWLFGIEMPERLVARLTATCYSLVTLVAGGLWAAMFVQGQSSVTTSLGDWFEIGDYHYQLVLMVDRLSMPLVALSVVLVGLVGIFSVRYLHRDAGFYRFFLLLHLFGFGILLLFTAGSFDLLIGGWELVGLTSVLLIAFFQHRNEPVTNALRVFATYRACDIGLLVAVVLMHHLAGSTTYATLFPAGWPNGSGVIAGSSATMLGALLLVASLGKAAQVPFSGWLPRAMEGPTPSSAIFYGALSVHAGAYLLLRAEPILKASPGVALAVIVVGILTAIHATMIGRACSDAKTSLAYASMAQLGVIFVEIGCGWSWLAIFHMTGHAVVRTLQFLRAPSMLHDFHQVHAAAGGHLGKTGAHYEQLFPEYIQAWLYRLALDRGHHDTVLDRFVVAPLLALANQLYRLEEGWSVIAFGPTGEYREWLITKAGLLSLRKKEEDISVH